MELSQDSKEWLLLLNQHRVEYVIVGAHALALHGAPRFTNDLDVLVRCSPENAKRLMDALDDFGFGQMSGLSRSDFEAEGTVVQLGRAPNRIDITTKLTGVESADVFEKSENGKMGGIPVRFISREHFVQNKLATGRTKDLADAERIQRKV